MFARMEALMQTNSSLTIDLINLAFARYWPKAAYLLAFHPSAYDKGAVVNEESIEKAQRLIFQDMYPLMYRAAEKSRGARAESKRFYALQICGAFSPCLNTSSRLAASIHLSSFALASQFSAVCRSGGVNPMGAGRWCTSP